jgi:hypothetical protein
MNANVKAQEIARYEHEVEVLSGELANQDAELATLKEQRDFTSDKLVQTKKLLTHIRKAR